MNQSKIQSFFRDQSIFITGGTGFIGKVLVEKLLRLCEPRKIYILVRQKKGKTIEERFDGFLSYPCFNRVKSQHDVKNKIVFISGDCEAPNLGLTKESEEILAKEITIVIHAAATVKFNEPLRRAANINVRGTRDVLELAKLMPRLKAFVHVSTAYSNCPHSDIREEFYDPPMTVKLLLDILDGMDDEILDSITQKLIGKFPNTYTFTKCIAEDLIRSVGRSLPIVVVRPAIVISSIKEPFPGWIDNFYGPLGILVGGALGVVRSLNIKQDYPVFLVPCDYVANTILAAAATIDKKKSTFTIYNYVPSNENVLTNKQFVESIHNYRLANPTEKAIWYPSVSLWENPLWDKICTFFLHTVVAYIIDFLFICIGRKPTVVKSYQKIDEMLSLMTYFNTRTWNFYSGNAENLWDVMEDDDKKLFCFNMNDIDWSSYLNSIISGAKLYLFKEAPDTLPRAIKKMRILRVAHYIVITVFLCLLLMFLRCILRLLL